MHFFMLGILDYEYLHNQLMLPGPAEILLEC